MIRRRSSFLWVMTVLCWSQLIQQGVVAVIRQGDFHDDSRIIGMTRSHISPMRVLLEDDEEESHVNATKTMEATTTAREWKQQGFGTIPMIVVAIGSAILFFSLLLLALWRRNVQKEREREQRRQRQSSHYSDSLSSFDSSSFVSDVSWDDTVAHNHQEIETTIGTNPNPNSMLDDLHSLDEHSVEMGTA